MKKEDKDFIESMLAIAFPLETLIDYKPDKCEKPNCRCVEIAEVRNGGNPVKSYPCLAKVSDIEQLKQPK